MVKIGHELVDGTLSIVMGREENDKTHTIAIIPYPSPAVELRQIVQANRVRGQYRPPGGQAWQEAGQCELPAHGPAQISLQCYQGPPAAEHWARFTDFQIRRLQNNSP
jgi:regulation of enolase protein 1 (concanavalin A-like superfamily)